MLDRNAFTLTDDRLLLRALQEADIPELVAAVQESIPVIMPWMDWCTPGYSAEQVRRWLPDLVAGWEQGRQYAFLITDVEMGRLLGGCSLNHINPQYRLANLSYWVRSSAAGQGIAPQAARLLARFGIEQLGLLRAEIVVAVDNHRSLRVAEKAGAKVEGILRNRLIVREQIQDAVMHSLTPQDFDL